MAWLDRLRERLTGAPAQPHSAPPAQAAPGARDPDEVAVERYRYMLRTAPPETIEQAHAEAFAKLTPQQRQRVLAEVGAGLPESERARTTEPRDLARMATRAEMSRPGTMERTLGGFGGPGMGGMIAGTLLASVAGAFIGTAIAGAFFDDYGDGFGDGFGDGYDDGYADGLAADDPGGDPGGGDFGGDLGGDFGDAGI
jgi:hypothetical protein